ncbi:hypothetical protein AB0A94_12030 [Streptomyces sp. NPDC044984]|uniref:hypothetical protein n=1 Tax=Streptomyces sp. NPDC044984 TaxID=3154335 RepID=UPI0033E4ED50
MGPCAADAHGHAVRLEPHGTKDGTAVALEDRPPLCSVEAGRIAGACTLSLRRRRPVRLGEART